MLLVKQNYNTHDVELLAIVEEFKTWRHYFEGAAYTILVLTNYNNLKKFMKTTCFSGCQIQWPQQFLCYNFKINYSFGTKNLADVLSRPLTDKDAKKELVKQNWKILDKL